MHDYNFKKQYTLMQECDIVFLPIIIRSPDEAIDIRSKSPNRIIDGIQSGKPVITNAGIESYNSFMPFAFFTNADYKDYANTILNLINMLLLPFLLIIVLNKMDVLNLGDFKII